jgi:hypothetical protein
MNLINTGDTQPKLPSETQLRSENPQESARAFQKMNFGSDSISGDHEAKS